MIIDSESKAYYRKKLNEAVSSANERILKGVYADLAAFERERGIIIGIGVALDLLEEPQPDPRAEETDDNQSPE